MSDVRINVQNVNQSVMKFIQDSSLTTHAVFGRPDKFDANSTNTTKWFQVYIPSLRQTVGHVTKGLCFEGPLLCECFSRSQSGQFLHLNMAAIIQDVLCHVLIPIRDYSTSSDDIIGYARLTEPVVRDRGLVGAYQKAELTIQFKVDQTV